MNRLPFMLADVVIKDAVQGPDRMDPRMYEVLITFGAIAVAVVIAIILAVVYSLKVKKRKHHRHRHHRHESAPANSSSVATASAPRVEEGDSRRGSRRQRRSRRPLNPTLAQTRGLPPLRDEDAPLPPLP